MKGVHMCQYYYILDMQRGRELMQCRWRVCVGNTCLLQFKCVADDH